MNYYYTGIGSRDTPLDVQNAMFDIAYTLCEKGYRLRSGGARGADTAFQAGVEEVVREHSLDSMGSLGFADIYLPWKNYKRETENYLPWWDIPYTYSPEAENLAKEVHPAWHKCSKGAKLMHQRNVYQVLGHWPPEVEKSDFVLYYAKETKYGKVSGGTATAVNVARKYGIPTINMYFDRWGNKLATLLNEPILGYCPQY